MSNANKESDNNNPENKEKTSELEKKELERASLGCADPAILIADTEDTEIAKLMKAKEKGQKKKPKERNAISKQLLANVEAHLLGSRRFTSYDFEQLYEFLKNT